MTVVGSLKDENQKALAWVVAANFAAFIIVLVMDSWVFDKVVLEAKNAWALVPAAGAAIIARVLSGLVNADWKARLIFWKWHNPLPGSYAFSQLGPRDTRVNMASIEQKLGQLPVGPEEENRAWYRLYKAVGEEPSVRSAHKEYLFSRDYACMATLFFMLMAPVAYWRVSEWQVAAVYASALIVQYLVVRLTAANAGQRFVTNVLAAHS